MTLCVFNIAMKWEIILEQVVLGNVHGANA